MQGMRSLYHINCSLPEYQKMLERYHQAANHDQVRHVFATTHPDTVDPFIIGSLGLEGDALTLALAPILCDRANEDLVIWGTKSEISWLNKQPMWRIWCANYTDEQRELFKSDWEYIEQMIANMIPEAAALWPEYNNAITYKQGREAIFALASNA